MNSKKKFTYHHQHVPKPVVGLPVRGVHHKYDCLSIALLILCSLQINLLYCGDECQSSFFPVTLALTNDDHHDHYYLNKPAAFLRKRQHSVSSILTVSNTHIINNTRSDEHHEHHEHHEQHEKMRMLNNNHQHQNKNNHSDMFGGNNSSSDPTSSPTIASTTTTSTTEYPTISSTTRTTETKVTSSPTFNPTYNPTTQSPTEESNNNNNDNSPTSSSPSPPSNPTSSTNTSNNTSTYSPSSSPTQYIPFFEREKNKAQEEEEQIIQLIHDPTANIIATIFIFIGIFGMLYTAQQILDNPNGLCTSCCRLSLTVTSLFIRLLCLPCTLICGYRYKGYTGSDPNNKAVFLQAEEYTNELELT